MISGISDKRSFYSHQVRDLSIIDLDAGRLLVIAVDSDGGIGELVHDPVYCTAFDLGRFSIRVPLMEIRASGAKPIAAFDMLTVPMDKYGKEIIRGVRAELLEADLTDNFPLSGSTEDNVPTTMTGVGTAVIGIAEKNEFRPGTTKTEDVILCIGLPKSAPDEKVLLNDPEIIKQSDLSTICKIENIHEILPVGSKGIAYEINQIEETVGLKSVIKKNIRINLEKSAGPSTCVIVTTSPDTEKVLKNHLNVPITKVGKFE